jgi:hypothetical protein
MNCKYACMSPFIWNVRTHVALSFSTSIITLIELKNTWNDKALRSVPGITSKCLMQEILSKTRTSPSHQNVRGESAKSLYIASEGQGPSLLTWHPFTTLRAWLFDKSRGRSSGPSSRLLCLARQHQKPISEPMKTRCGCLVTFAIYGDSNKLWLCNTNRMEFTQVPIHITS